MSILNYTWNGSLLKFVLRFSIKVVFTRYSRGFYQVTMLNYTHASNFWWRNLTKKKITRYERIIAATRVLSVSSRHLKDPANVNGFYNVAVLHMLVSSPTLSSKKSVLKTVDIIVVMSVTSVKRLNKCISLCKINRILWSNTGNWYTEISNKRLMKCTVHSFAYVSNSKNLNKNR